MWVASWVFSSPCSSSACPHPRWPRTPPRRRSTSSPRASPRTPAPPARRARRRCTTRSRRCATTSPTPQLPTYFKSEALDPGNTIVRTETIPSRPGVEIRRDALRRPPHLRADRRRRDLRRRLRDRGGPQPAAQPGPLRQPHRGHRRARASAIDLVSNLYQFAPSKQTERIVVAQTRVLQQGRPQGRAAAARHRHLPRWHQRLVLGQPARTRRRSPATTSTPSTRSRASTSARAAARRPPTRSSSPACRGSFGASQGLRRLQGPRGPQRPDDRDDAQQAGALGNPTPHVAQGRGRHQERQLRASRRPKLAAAARARAASLASNILVASRRALDARATRCSSAGRRSRTSSPGSGRGDGPARARTSTCAAPPRRRSPATCSSAAASTSPGR